MTPVLRTEQGSGTGETAPTSLPVPRYHGLPTDVERWVTAILAGKYAVVVR